MTPPLGLGGTTECDRTDLLPPGYRVGSWVVTGLIGSGGWSTVYAARPGGVRPVRSPAGDGTGPGGSGPGPPRSRSRSCRRPLSRRARRAGSWSPPAARSNSGAGWDIPG